MCVCVFVYVCVCDFLAVYDLKKKEEKSVVIRKDGRRARAVFSSIFYDMRSSP